MTDRGKWVIERQKICILRPKNVWSHPVLDTIKSWSFWNYNGVLKNAHRHRTPLSTNWQSRTKTQARKQFLKMETTCKRKSTKARRVVWLLHARCHSTNIFRWTNVRYKTRLTFHSIHLLGNCWWSRKRRNHYWTGWSRRSRRWNRTPARSHTRSRRTTGGWRTGRWRPCRRECASWCCGCWMSMNQNVSSINTTYSSNVKSYNEFILKAFFDHVTNDHWITKWRTKE